MDPPDAVAALSGRLTADFPRAVQLLLGCSGRVVVSGIGKSGHIGRKVAATLASTGTPAFFVHPAEASHGDLGMVTRDDVLIAFSNSGETLSVTAPGYGVNTAWLENQRVSFSGTSASAPLVAGAIAAVMSQNPGVGAAGAWEILAAHTNEAGAPGADARYDSFVARTKDHFANLDALEFRARTIVGDLALALQGSLLLRHGHPAIADAFVGSRLGGEWGSVYGTLGAGVDTATIIERTLPKLA